MGEAPRLIEKESEASAEAMTPASVAALAQALKHAPVSVRYDYPDHALRDWREGESAETPAARAILAALPDWTLVRREELEALTKLALMVADRNDVGYALKVQADKALARLSEKP